MSKPITTVNGRTLAAKVAAVGRAAQATQTAPAVVPVPPNATTASGNGTVQVQASAVGQATTSGGLTVAEIRKR